MTVALSPGTHPGLRPPQAPFANLRSCWYWREGGGRHVTGVATLDGPGVHEAVPDRLGLVIFVPSCGPRVDRSGDRGKHHLCSAPIGMANLGALASSGGPPPCPTVLAITSRRVRLARV